MSSYIFKTPDGKEFNIKDFKLDIKLKQMELGTITIGGLSTGDTMSNTENGIYIFRTDGTKQFISYRWFL